MSVATAVRTLLLTASDVAELLDPDRCYATVEDAFRGQADGRAGPTGILGYPSPSGGGGFHVKAAALALGRRGYFAAKVNANFPENRRRLGLPAIQGIVALFDSADGRPLALIDSIEITSLRTAAATAVAARRLAKPESRVATVCGCGKQGRAQLVALSRVLPIERAFAFDADAAAARALAEELSGPLGIEITPVAEAARAVLSSDVCVTATPARAAFLRRADLPPGIFVAAVGADSADKQELSPDVLAGATVVVDSISQCAEIGELHHALAAGFVERSDVHGELWEVVSGRKPGRRTADEVVVFDSTGIAVEDVAAAAAVYERALELGRGTACELAA